MLKIVRTIFRLLQYSILRHFPHYLQWYIQIILNFSQNCLNSLLVGEQVKPTSQQADLVFSHSFYWTYNIVCFHFHREQTSIARIYCLRSLLRNNLSLSGIVQQNKEMEIAIRNQTWDLFRTKYKSKFKKDYASSIFTVLSSINLINQEGKTLIVSAAFGTKSLPQSVITQQNREDLLSDMHAQILAIQGFKRFLLEELKKEESIFLSWDSKRQKFRLKKDYKLCLYVSQLFCGDCCINQDQSSFSGAKPLRSLSQQFYGQGKFEHSILRTKPGRVDLPIAKRSHLFSCSDLVALTCILGVQGCELFAKIIPIYFDTVIIDCPERYRESVKRGLDLQKRLSNLLKKDESLIRRKIFNIVIEGKQRIISHQFSAKKPNIVLLERQKAEEKERDREGFELCGIFSCEKEEWINGKSGLPEGSSLKNYKSKGKVSSFSEAKLKLDFPAYQSNETCFKYEAIESRLKVLFNQWLP